ncbi:MULTISPECIES: hypothetical protein [Pseudomonas]|uniref:hypothetical protein n=1 Tax=Pseudomonas TaxID=286 RepID=UPI00215CEF05|nr:MULTISPECIES: hypothetical protein [unclassified Pseudomonas]MCR8931102.1 hypothetical protein [Pseudomonas sp. S11A4]MCR8974710.1 hypothetical protein [Pseudomonas sp. S11P7]
MKEQVKYVGGEKGSYLMAFGDDSAYKGVLCFAYIIFVRTKLKRIQRQIRELKVRFKIPLSTALHCRVLNSGQQRLKSGLGHLTESDIQSIYSSLVYILNYNSVRVKYAHGVENDVKQNFDGPFENFSQNGAPFPVQYDPKGMLGLLAQICFVDAKAVLGVGVDDIEIYLASDQTKVKFLGHAKRQAHHWAHGMIDVGASSGLVVRVKPEIGDGGYPELLELADFVAYTACHAVLGKESEPFYFGLLSQVKQKQSMEFFGRPE